MTIPGPADRTLQIDDSAGLLKDVTALTVGEWGGVAEIEQVLQEMTNPASTAPVFLPSGFKRCTDLTVTLQCDVGGAIDPYAQFYANQDGARTVTFTSSVGKTFTCESYIQKSRLVPNNEQLTLVEVVFKFTGSATIV